MKVTDEYIDEILEAKYNLLDAMGVVQHHDAVSGTARQLVSEDYTDILNIGINGNSWRHAKVINDIINKDTGYNATFNNWMQCSQDNSSAEDYSCPYNSDILYFGVQNPSTNDYSQVTY